MSLTLEAVEEGHQMPKAGVFACGGKNPQELRKS
jgi:hypothetical protein